MILAFLFFATLAEADPGDTAPIACGACADWNAPRAPFRVHGGTHYVGPAGVSVLVVETSRGLVLFDGGLPQTAPLVVENLRALGKRIEDVKWIFISHPHFDHVGGVAALARLSGARVGATPSAAAVLRAGMVGKDDPQAGAGDAMRFPPVPKERVVELRDGARVRLGEVSFTMHATPGHTPGGSAWTWRSCEPKRAAGRCLDIVYADSLTPVSSPGFRFSDDPARVRQFRRTIKKIGALPCDVLVAAHPQFTGLFDKLAARDEDPAHDALVDPGACRAYAEGAARGLQERLAREKAELNTARP